MRDGINLGLIAVLFMVAGCPKRDDGIAIKKTSEDGTRVKQEPDVEPANAPEKHRPVGEPCAREIKRETFGPRMVTPPGPPCKTNGDCTEAKNGRCSVAKTCTYDQCYVDSDCTKDGAKGVCVCHEEGRNGYSCLPGNCSVDSDCGASGFCSPTYGMSCGPFTGVIGYYCHTKKDKCRDDSDCRKDGTENHARGYCAYNPEVGYWSCGYGMCVG